MPLLSHPPPTNVLPADAQFPALLLASAFTEFISASTRLEASYSDLQREVTYLGEELAERNVALQASLVENGRMHHTLQKIVDAMPCGILVVEGSQTISMINPEGIRLLNLESSPDVRTVEVISQASGIDIAAFLRCHADADGEQEFHRVSCERDRWLVVQYRSLQKANHSKRSFATPSQTILILRDVTAQKQAEHARERARKAMALAEVAATLAHEIRNPLTSLELFAGLISNECGGTSQWISHLRAGIRSLAGTVNNVLSFHGVGFSVLVPLDLNACLCSSVAFARPIAEQAGISLVFVGEEHAMEVRGNGSALQQLVLNMVCNAVRHTPSGGRVEVSVSRIVSIPHGDEGDLARIDFVDSGCGIPPEHFESIFDAGFSGSGTTSGLGLAVCSQIVAQHKGAMWVTSVLQQGSTFHVELPIL